MMLGNLQHFYVVPQEHTRGNIHESRLVLGRFCSKHDLILCSVAIPRNVLYCLVWTPTVSMQDISLVPRLSIMRGQKIEPGIKHTHMR